MVLSEKQKKLAVVLTLALSVFIVDRAFLADSLTGPQEAVADVGEAVDLWASLVRAACRRRPRLIVTPELIIRGKDREKGAD